MHRNDAALNLHPGLPHVALGNAFRVKNRQAPADRELDSAGDGIAPVGAVVDPEMFRVIGQLDVAGIAPSAGRPHDLHGTAGCFGMGALVGKEKPHALLGSFRDTRVEIDAGGFVPQQNIRSIFQRVLVGPGRMPVPHGEREFDDVARHEAIEPVAIGIIIGIEIDGRSGAFDEEILRHVPVFLDLHHDRLAVGPHLDAVDLREAIADIPLVDLLPGKASFPQIGTRDHIRIVEWIGEVADLLGIENSIAVGIFHAIGSAVSIGVGGERIQSTGDFPAIRNTIAVRIGVVGIRAAGGFFSVAPVRQGGFVPRKGVAVGIRAPGIGVCVRFRGVVAPVEIAVGRIDAAPPWMGIHAVGDFQGVG